MRGQPSSGFYRRTALPVPTRASYDTRVTRVLIYSPLLGELSGVCNREALFAYWKVTKNASYISV